MWDFYAIRDSILNKKKHAHRNGKKLYPHSTPDVNRCEDSDEMNLFIFLKLNYSPKLAIFSGLFWLDTRTPTPTRLMRAKWKENLKLIFHRTSQRWGRFKDKHTAWIKQSLESMVAPASFEKMRRVRSCLPAFVVVSAAAADRGRIKARL